MKKKLSFLNKQNLDDQHKDFIRFVKKKEQKAMESQKQKEEKQKNLKAELKIGTSNCTERLEPTGFDLNSQINNQTVAIRDFKELFRTGQISETQLDAKISLFNIIEANRFWHTSEYAQQFEINMNGEKKLFVMYYYLNNNWEKLERKNAQTRQQTMEIAFKTWEESYNPDISVLKIEVEEFKGKFLDTICGPKDLNDLASQILPQLATPKLPPNTNNVLYMFSCSREETTFIFSHGYETKRNEPANIAKCLEAKLTAEKFKVLKDKKNILIFYVFTKNV